MVVVQVDGPRAGGGGACRDGQLDFRAASDTYPALMGQGDDHVIWVGVASYFVPASPSQRQQRLYDCNVK